MEELDTVKCPNNCDSGEIKYTPDAEFTGWLYVKCQYCNGTGKVSKTKRDDLNKII